MLRLMLVDCETVRLGETGRERQRDVFETTLESTLNASRIRHVPNQLTPGRSCTAVMSKLCGQRASRSRSVMSVTIAICRSSDKGHRIHIEEKRSCRQGITRRNLRIILLR
jgi:hypothetical protein